MVSELLTNYTYAGKTLTRNTYDYIYLSPHLDDAAFSCSGTICVQQAQKCSVLVATLFAGDPQPPFPALAQACHQLWHIPEDTSPYHTRRIEDEQAMAALNVDYLWLNWREVIYRDPTLHDLSAINDDTSDVYQDPLYPTLCRWLKDLHNAYPQAKIVAPLSVGRHHDHRITFQAALNTLARTDLLFYEDFPYAAYLPDERERQVQADHLVPLEVDISPFLEQRIHATGLYHSQHAMLFFPASAYQELIRTYTSQTNNQGRSIERYWKLPQ